MLGLDPRLLLPSTKKHGQCCDVRDRRLYRRWCWSGSSSCLMLIHPPVRLPDVMAWHVTTPPPLSSVLAHGKWSKTGRGESLKTRLIKFRLGILLMCDAWTLSGHNQFLKEARLTWHARSPTVSTHFDQCNTSPHQLLLGWPGDGDCYLMDKMQSGGWPYPHDMCMFVDVLHN